MAGLSALLQDGRINSTTAARLLEFLLEDEGTPEDIARERGLLQETDPGAIAGWIDSALEAHPQACDDVRKGGNSQNKALGFLTGQVMKLSRGTAPPQEVQKLLRERILGDS